MKGILGLSLLPLLTVASPVMPSTIHNDAAPILSSTNAVEVPDSYIIVFKDHVTPSSAAAHHSWVQDVHMQHSELRKRSQFPFSGDVFAGLKHTFDIAGSFLGYSGHFDENVIETIRRHPDVKPLPEPSPFTRGLIRILTNAFLMCRLITSRKIPLSIPWSNQQLRRTLHGAWPVSLIGTA